MNDLAIYAVHAACGLAFALTRWYARSSPAHGPAAPVEAQAPATVTSPWSRTLVGLHSLAFGLMYFGIGNSVIPHRVPRWFAGQQIVGTLIIATGAFMGCWSLLHFRSWRFRARIEQGHRLATGGPFAIVRHPIYLGLGLMAIGSAVWVPTPSLWIAAVLMVVVCDLRARAEEAVLELAFGDEYRAYRQRTRRFLPGIY